ncbi:NUDIX domain-containing protein [Streptomyces sp. M10(2022)]
MPASRLGSSTVRGPGWRKPAGIRWSRWRPRCGSPTLLSSTYCWSSTACADGAARRQGGAGETPRAAAVRELLEETGLRSELLPEPAAVAVRSYRADWSATLGLSYAAVAGRDVPLAGEQNQPAAWFRLDADWDSVFPEDRERIRAHARRLAAGRAVGSR